MLEHKICSKILDIILVRELAGSWSCSTFLKRGVTFAIFQSFGTTLVLREQSKITLRIEAIDCAFYIHQSNLYNKLQTR